MTISQQASLLAEGISDGPLRQRGEIKMARSGTFTDNMKLPIHRWFRYSAGFSAEWVEELIRSFRPGSAVRVLDPFAGSGTTLLAASAAGASSVGFESHPFVARIAKAKLLWHKVASDDLTEAVAVLVGRARSIRNPSLPVSPLLEKCYTKEAMSALFSLRETLVSSPPEDEALAEMIRLCLTAILRSCSHVGTAQWQYILPSKSKGKVLDPFEAMLTKASEMAKDISFAKKAGFCPDAIILDHDAREPSELPEGSVDLVITSPPYPNNYDYADATRLEMTFWGEIDSWGDLQKTVRRHIVRSCSQHTAAERLKLDDLLSLDVVDVIRDELASVCRELEIVRLTKGGRKTYHTMIAAYYADLSKVFRSLRPVCAKGAKLCFVIGDSAPYGVHAPAEKWLGLLAESAGFHSVSFEKLRDRNIKWKNRKHTVPLQEGRLWFEG